MKKWVEIFLGILTAMGGFVEVGELVYGKTGLLARLGLTHARATTLAWESVKEIRDGKIIVDRNTEG